MQRFLPLGPTLEVPMSQSRPCDDCRQAPSLTPSETRRDFLTKSAASLAALGTFAPAVWAGTDKRVTAESYAGELFNALTEDQRKILCFKADDPLRQKASANW